MPAPYDNQNALDNDGGRPSKYKPEFAQQAYKLCLLGHTDAQLAQFFEVCESTINNWKASHVEFLESVTRGKTIADADVAVGFFQRATGYTYQETTFEKVDGRAALELTPTGELLTDAYRKKVVTKHLPPDPAAALNWLANRQPDQWRNKVDHHVTGKNGGAIEHNLNAVRITAEDVRAFKEAFDKKY